VAVANTTIDATDNISKVWGRHTIKGGTYFQRSRKNQTSFGNFNGNYNFADNSSNPYDTNFGYANAAIGVYNSFSQAANMVNGQYRYSLRIVGASSPRSAWSEYQPMLGNIGLWRMMFLGAI